MIMGAAPLKISAFYIRVPEQFQPDTAFSSTRQSVHKAADAFSILFKLLKSEEL